jgi:hypothetical protein
MLYPAFRTRKDIGTRYVFAAFRTLSFTPSPTRSSPFRIAVTHPVPVSR